MNNTKFNVVIVGGGFSGTMLALHLLRRAPTIRPTTKGCLWEITAVPEIRLQCQKLAEHITGVLVAPAKLVPASMSEIVA